MARTFYCHLEATKSAFAPCRKSYTLDRKMADTFSNALDVLYHHAKFGEDRTTRTKICCLYVWIVALPFICRFRQRLMRESKFNSMTHSVTDLWKKNIGGSPSVRRVEAPQALTCNTNTGVRIDPPQELKSTETRGVKKIIGRVEPPTPPPANRTLDTLNETDAVEILTHRRHLYSGDNELQIQVQ